MIHDGSNNNRLSQNHDKQLIGELSVQASSSVSQWLSLLRDKGLTSWVGVVSVLVRMLYVERPNAFNVASLFCGNGPRSIVGSRDV